MRISWLARLVLSANLNKKSNLDKHLGSNLKLGGVTKNLKNTVFPFNYNDFKQLKNIVEKNNIGVIKMEVVRNHNPKENFLNKVRKLASKKNIVLIFDEVYSGWGKTGNLFYFMNFKGLIPDILTSGKSLGGGKASISAYTCREKFFKK